MKRFLSMLLCMSMIFTLFVCVPVSASTEVEYTGPKSIYYLNFEGATVGTTGVDYNGVTATDEHGTNYTATVKQDSGDTNKYLNVAKSATGNTRLNFAATTTEAHVGADKYVIEYKIRPHLGTAGVIKPRTGGGDYGVLTAALYKGKIREYTTSGDNAIGSYTDNTEWYTFTIVYDADYVDSTGAQWVEGTSTGTKYYVRDVYLNGEKLNDEGIKHKVTSSETNFLTSSATMKHMFWLYNSASAAYDLDYMRYYASADEFAAKLPNTTDVAKDSIEVWFNNIPTEAELLSKVSVVDASGTKVAGISRVTYNNNFDPGMDYAQSVNLVFDTELGEGTSYKLNISGLSDFAGNTLSTQLDFKTSSTLVTTEWSNHKSIAYWDFEEVAAGTYFSSAKTESVEGLTGITGDRRTGTTSVVTEGENNYFNLSTSASSDTQTERFIFSVAKASVPDADKYIIEYKIRNDLGLRGVMKAHPVKSYGVDTASFYQNRILTTGTDYVGNPDSVIGSYEDGEWYTVTVVYDGSYKTEDGVEKTVRDVYINGELAEEDVTEDKISAGTLSTGEVFESDFINQAYLMRTALYLYGTEDETSQSVDIDYVKFYASADTFAAKLGETEEVSPDIGIEVQFNNIPVKSDLLSKVKVINATTGEEVCGISSVTYNNNFNVGETYAQSVTLNFDKILSENTTYKLRINGVKDISNNTTNLEESFTTGEMSFEYGSFEFAGDNKTVSIDITKNISADKVYKLIIAGYEEYNGGLKMVSAAEKDITITSGTNTYTSNALDITGDYVKAFLWDDMKPVVTQGEKSITQ